MKKRLLLIVAFVLLMGPIFAQVNGSTAALTAAIYEEEVSGNLNKAVTLYQDILKKYPNDRQVAAKTLYHLGLVSEKMGKQKADEYYQQLVNNYPDQTEMATLARAKLALYKNANSEATKQAEKSFKQATDLFKQLKYGEAVAEYEKVIKLASDSGLAQEALLWIGHCYFKLGKYEVALKSFNTILKEYPKSNLVQVAELMIVQIQQTIAKEPPKHTVVVLDEKTIMDPVTAIRYTKVNTWAGKNDVITSSSQISDISPNRKFILAENKIVPFDDIEPLPLFDSSLLIKKSRLSPKGNEIVFFNKNELSVLPVSPETGRPTGQPRRISSGHYESCTVLSWAPDNNSLLFSFPDDNQAENQIERMWMFSTKDGSKRQPTNIYYKMADPVFPRSGLCFLYNRNGSILMKSSEVGKSLTILDYCWSDKRFILSPEGKWIIYKKMPGDKSYLYSMADKQQMELSTPLEVGDFVSWTEAENKVFFFSPSVEDHNVLKIASVFGGPPFELEKQSGQLPVSWTPDCKAIIAEKSGDGKKVLGIINLTDQLSKTIDGLSAYNNYSFSPDHTKILVQNYRYTSFNNLYVVPVSLKDNRVSGIPILVFKNYYGILGHDSWSPDGQKIAVSWYGDIWICNADGSNSNKLTNKPITEINPERWSVEDNPKWSPAGNVIAVYNRLTSQLHIISASDGQILLTNEKVDTWDWTPDGKEITIAERGGQLNSISLATRTVRKITNWKETGQFSDLTDLKWSPDGKWIAVNGYRADSGNKTHLYLISAASGKALELDADDARIKRGFIWSPDSKWISYYINGPKKNRLESTLWEADLTDFRSKIEHGTETGYTTDYDFKTSVISTGGVDPDGTFTDIRDGHVYGYKKIGTQTWMTENLAYLPVVSPDSVISFVDKRYYVYGYTGSDVNEAKRSENYHKYGVLYNWTAAMDGAASSNLVPSGVKGICPAGWHLPSDAEWMVLEKNLGMSTTDLELTGPRASGSVDKKLKSVLEWDDDDLFIGQSGFNALPGGSVAELYRQSRFKQFAAFFWNSTELNGNQAGIRLVFRYYGVGFQRAVGYPKSYGLSVRCVKD